MLNALQIFQVLRFSTTLLIGVLLLKVVGFSTAEVAMYEVLLFLGNFVSFFWISAGQKGLLTLFPSYTIDQQGRLLFNIFLVLLGFGLVAASGLYLCQNWIVDYWTQYEQLPFLYLVCLYLFFNAPAQLTEYIYLLHQQERPIIYYGIVLHVLLLIAICLPLYLGFGIEGLFIGLVMWSILKFLWLLRLLLRYAIFSLDWVLQKKFLWLIFPLCLHALLGGGMEYIDGFIVTHHFEEEKMFALFRYGARELPLVSILVAALVATLIPIAVENEVLATNQIKVKVQQLSKWLYPITILLMLCSPYLFPLVYNEDFALSAKVFNIYLLVISSRLLLPQVFIHSRQHNYILVFSAIIELIVNLSLSLYLVPSYGLEGIAFATVVAYMLNKVLLIGYTQYQLGIPLGDYLDIKSYLLYNLILIFFFFIYLS